MVKYSSKKRTRRHRQSVSGKILPPIDVRSAGDFGGMIKRLTSGPLTVVLVYADWCGHCHHFMPHFDAAAKSPSRSVQAVKINESVLSQANSYINKNVNSAAKPIDVQGYPSVLLVKKDGTVLNEVNATKDTKVMTEVMSQAAPLAEEAGLTESTSNENEENRNRMRMRKNLGLANEGAVSTGDNSMRNYPTNEASLLGNVSISGTTNESDLSLASLSKNGNENATSIRVTPQEVKSIAALHSVNGNSGKPAVPPNSEGDRDEGVSYNANRPRGIVGGGSLYHAMAQAAYTLAPTAVLFAAAAGLKKRTTRKTQKRRGNKKKTRRYRKK